MRKIEVTSRVVGRVVGLVPIDKHDHEAAERAIVAGYPAIESSLPRLLEWIQDMNWPVAQTLAPFLASIGEPLIPHLEVIFETEDEIWKAWIISRIVGESLPLAVHFRYYLEKLVDQETKDEDDEWVRDNARDVLEKYGWL
ncbi:MAG: DUF5071 domain-containing protein [Pyrinomonadaceae bacterium]